MIDKKFHTSVYPKDPIYWAQFQTLLKIKRQSTSDWFNLKLVDEVDNEMPVGTTVTSYVQKHIERPPLPWESRANLIRKLKNMTKEQLIQYDENLVKCREITRNIIDEKVRFELG